MRVRILKNCHWSHHNFRVRKGQSIHIEDESVDNDNYSDYYRIIKEGGDCWVNEKSFEPVSALEQLADCAN